MNKLVISWIYLKFIMNIPYIYIYMYIYNFFINFINYLCILQYTIQYDTRYRKTKNQFTIWFTFWQLCQGRLSFSMFPSGQNFISTSKGISNLALKVAKATSVPRRCAKPICMYKKIWRKLEKREQGVEHLQ